MGSNGMSFVIQAEHLYSYSAIDHSTYLSKCFQWDIKYFIFNQGGNKFLFSTVVITSY